MRETSANKDWKFQFINCETVLPKDVKKFFIPSKENVELNVSCGYTISSEKSSQESNLICSLHVTIANKLTKKGGLSHLTATQYC